MMVRKIVAVICNAFGTCKDFLKEPTYTYVESIEYWKRIEHVDQPPNDYFHKKGQEMIGKLRPQIFLAILVLGGLAALGALNGFPEIATGTIGGIIALGMKVLENE